jgi:hypothetical protein
LLMVLLLLLLLAGGDHLIPWASSSLLFPHALPSWPGQLPAPALWARQPAIVQWPQPSADAAEAAAAPAAAADLAYTQQEQDHLLQQQEQELQHEFHQPDATPLPGSMPADDNDDEQANAGSAAAAAAAAGPLSLRLLQLQSVGAWCHFHVVWPRLCLGSSHTATYR